MSDDPLTGISFRDSAITDSKPFIDVAQPLLREVVDFADQTFWRCFAVAADRPDQADYPPLVLYRHVTEMTDGIEILISGGASSSCVPILRSCFEAWLSLAYIMEKETEYRKRSLAWLCAYLHGEIEQKQILDPTTRSGAELKKRLETEAPEGLRKLGPVDNVKLLQEQLDGPDFVRLEAEFQRRTNKGRQRPPFWCSLVPGGPTSRQKLADHLGQGAIYQVFYGCWSKFIHGSDPSRFQAKLPDGTEPFKLLRDPEPGMRDYAFFGIWFANGATKWMLNKFIPGEDFGEREKEVMKGLKRLVGFKLKFELSAE
jgi:hypothetical protein